MLKGLLNQRSALVRKSAVGLLQVPRTWRRLAAGRADYQKRPPIICNSFPKSGTHLLAQVLEALPGVRTYGTFIASMPSVPFRERSQAATLRKLHRVAAGELVAAHLFFDDAYADVLTQRHAVHYFIYRDLRDVAISEAHYLTYMNRWHRLHRYYRKMDSDEQRITWAIRGESDPAFAYDYPDIAQRFERYSGWLDCKDVCAVRFEDLIGLQRRDEIARIVRYYLDHSGRLGDVDQIVNKAFKLIDPALSRTFRKGQAGGWRDVLTDKQRELIKQVAGDLLVELGYQQSSDR